VLQISAVYPYPNWRYDQILMDSMPKILVFQNTTTSNSGNGCAGRTEFAPGKVDKIPDTTMSWVSYSAADFLCYDTPNTKLVENLLLKVVPIIYFLPNHICGERVSRIGCSTSTALQGACDGVGRLRETRPAWCYCSPPHECCLPKETVLVMAVPGSAAYEADSVSLPFLRERVPWSIESAVLAAHCVVRESRIE